MIEEVQSWMPFAGSLAAFLASHAIPARPPIRRRLVGIVGERVYLILYSIMSLVLLGWLFQAAAEAPYVELWPELDWQHLVPRILVPLAFALGTIGLLTANPLSLSIGRQGPEPAPSSILGVTRHPVLWALALWAAAHMIPNGDLAHFLLFGTLLALCLGGMMLMDRRAARQLGTARWLELAATRPLVPFSRPGALHRPTWREVWLGLSGLLLAAGIATLHGAVIGVPAL